MKQLLFFLLFSILILTCACQSKSSQANPLAGTKQIEAAAAEVSFSFTRLNGSASNQFAVWIEDSHGRHLKTLYAAGYTAKGGWKRRETSIPLWVKKSGLANLTNAQIDTLTGATPKTGTLTYTWDGKDSTGAPVTAGEYFLLLEGTLRWENQVLYRAPILLGKGEAAAEVSVEYKGDPGADRRMIDDVRVKTLR